jgi:tetratricopeptide (TPR) repeat protein
MLSGLLVTSVAGKWCGDSLRRTPTADRGSAIESPASLGGVNHQLSEAVLGGFRGLAADVIWLRAYVAWERRDPPLVTSLIDLATQLDERSLSFWLNGARMIAYDFPAWENEQRMIAGGVSREDREDVHTYATQALALLERGIRAHPVKSALRIEYANVQLNRLHDVAGAAATYREAAELDDAPFYAARLHAELLRRLGRNEEALAWLIRLHPQLPPQIEGAGADLVLSRIRALETELHVAPSSQYRSQTGGLSIDPTLTLNDVGR